jgi:hypothetical protein
MKIHRVKTQAICLLCFFTCTIQMACKKLIEVDEPINSITTAEIFATDATATSAMAGVYSEMINGSSGGSTSSTFSSGDATGYGAASSDELHAYIYLNNPSADFYGSNHLTVFNATGSTGLWSSAYTIIYKSNSVIEGVAASRATMLHDSVRKELTAEAKFTRAFSYFYLTNFFGDVPMALTVDFNTTENLPRMPQPQVYQQIISDLKDAQAGLSADYSVGHGERIIPNKWAATLLLARVYLYMRDYADAAAQANVVINNSTLFALEPDLANVFSTTSREAIWQLKQTTNDGTLQNATPEGRTDLPLTMDGHGQPQTCITDQLLSAFEPGDQRRVKWVGSTDNADGSSTLPATTYYYPYKYVIGIGNSDPSQPPSQYYMVLRLAEAYLILAEAEANGATGGTAAAITALNVIRNRAGLPNLNSSLNQQQVLSAVAQERRIEFFAEWGHRWFDLKRTGQAHAVLSVIPAKQPWAGDYQLLYPIPQSEITADHFLTQNPGY